MATVEERLALLEAKLSVEPRALTPPITIGELTNVPSPGSQIAAQWAQDVSSRVVQRFPTTAGLKAYAAVVGSFAVALDTGVLWQRVATGWTQVTPWASSVAGVTAINAGYTTLATIAVPADPGPRIITASCLLRVDRFKPSAELWVQLVVDGTVQGETIMKPELDSSPQAGNMVPCFASMSAAVLAATAGSTVTMQLWASAAAYNTPWQTYASAKWNRLNVSVAPRGY